MSKLFEAKLCERFTFDALYLKFDIIGPHVLVCQNKTEYISKHNGYGILLNS